MKPTFSEARSNGGVLGWSNILSLDFGGDGWQLEAITSSLSLHYYRRKSPYHSKSPSK